MIEKDPQTRSSNRDNELTKGFSFLLREVHFVHSGNVGTKITSQNKIIEIHNYIIF